MKVWSDLNPDLLLSIAKYTTIKDHIVLRAVCKSWGSILLDDNYYISAATLSEQQLPWGLFPCHRLGQDDGRCLLYSLSEKHHYFIDLPEFYRYRCCGSSHGWLIFTDNTPAMFMMNPLTGRRIELPPITTILLNGSLIDYDESNIGEEYGYIIHNGTKYCRDSETMKRYFVTKVILTGNPSLDKNYFVILLGIENGYLGICREGDDQWTSVDFEHNGVSDIVHCNGSICYAICRFYRVFRLDLQVGLNQKPSVAKISRSKDIREPFDSYPSIAVASGNNILMVNRKYKFFRERKIEDGSRCICIGCGYSDNDNDDDEDQINEEEEDIDEDSCDYDEEDYDSADEEESDQGSDDDDDAHDDDDDDENSGDGTTEDEDEDEEEEEEEEILSVRTVRFRVYMLNTENRQTTRVRNIGENALFLGNSPCMVVPAERSQENEVCKPNHIYFMGFNPLGFMKNDIGVMHIKTNKRRGFPGCSRLSSLLPRQFDFPTAVWFTPSLH